MSTTSGILPRITALVRLTASDNENEAKNAAVEACRLIRVHGLIIVRPIDVPKPGPEPIKHYPPPPPGQRPVHEVAADILRGARRGTPTRNPMVDDIEGVEAKMDAYEAELAAERAAKAQRNSNVMRPVVMASPDRTPIQIKAKFAGTCEDCHKAYAQGAAIWYRRGVGCVHGSCDPGALV